MRFSKNKRKKKLFVVTYVNRQYKQKENYIWAYTENEAVSKFLKFAEKANIIAVDEVDEAY